MSQTVLYGSRESTVSGALSEGDALWVPLAGLERATGWELKPQGLCQGDTCVPVPEDRKSEWVDESGRFNLAAFAGHLGQPIARDDAHGVWSFGEPVRRGQEATGGGPVPAPDFTLPDLDGRPHSLSDYRGRKVFLFCWASW